MRKVKGIMIVFAVSWVTGQTYKAVPCAGKEPDGIVCAQTVQTRTEKVFKNEDAAKEFKDALAGSQAVDVKMEKRDK